MELRTNVVVKGSKSRDVYETIMKSVNPKVNSLKRKERIEAFVKKVETKK